MKSKVLDFEIEVKNLNTQIKRMSQEKQLHLEEIQLLKDYTYGVDHRAKDIHMHKFIHKNEATEPSSVTKTIESTFRPNNC